MTPRQWKGIPYRYTGEEIGAHRPMRDEDGIIALRNALPLIADVVEAAEYYSEHFSREVGTNSLVESLTALRDALEEK